MSEPAISRQRQCRVCGAAVQMTPEGAERAARMETSDTYACDVLCSHCVGALERWQEQG